jgi:hypothetical protein
VWPNVSHSSTERGGDAIIQHVTFSISTDGAGHSASDEGENEHTTLVSIILAEQHRELARIRHLSCTFSSHEKIGLQEPVTLGLACRHSKPPVSAALPDISDHRIARDYNTTLLEGSSDVSHVVRFPLDNVPPGHFPVRVPVRAMCAQAAHLRRDLAMDFALGRDPVHQRPRSGYPQPNSAKKILARESAPEQ